MINYSTCNLQEQEETEQFSLTHVQLKESQAARDEAAVLKPEDGPIVKRLDLTLQEMKVQRQVYHGKSFVGNHIHRCCQVGKKILIYI